MPLGAAQTVSFAVRMRLEINKGFDESCILPDWRAQQSIAEYRKQGGLLSWVAV